MVRSVAHCRHTSRAKKALPFVRRATSNYIPPTILPVRRYPVLILRPSAIRRPGSTIRYWRLGTAAGRRSFARRGQRRFSQTPRQASVRSSVLCNQASSRSCGSPSGWPPSSCCRLINSFASVVNDDSVAAWRYNSRRKATSNMSSVAQQHG